jgi:hypothetical protein
MATLCRLESQLTTIWMLCYPLLTSFLLEETLYVVLLLAYCHHILSIMVQSDMHGNKKANLRG